MRVYVDCVGCEQRNLDAQRVVDYLKANEVDISDSPLGCDYSIIITCGVDSSNEQRSLSRIEQISKSIPKNGKLIVGGCLPSISPSRLSKYDIYGTFSPRDIYVLNDLLGLSVTLDDISYPNRSRFDSEQRFGVSSDLSPREEYDMAKRGFKLRISEGCLGNCSYCMIRKATGRLKSESPDSIAKQMKDGIEMGERTVMLMAGDTGAYGRDLGIRFYDLLRDLISVHGDYQVFIHDFNVNWLIRNLDEYIDIFRSRNGHKIRGSNFPMQSGSNRILRLMRRPYTAEDAISALKRTRTSAPHIFQGSHIIVGFPGETNEDFERTLEMLDDVGFDFVTCFRYSEHEMSDSASLPDKVSNDVVNERLDRTANSLGDKVKIIG
ncbi:MAG: hypothetical protein COS47_01085 [Candidatus Nealsonbacteria bacterium CG03_land_8_20_14_0_80_36_12]|uniref:Uncharacterized protein n=1 Tax=Candidatus Nealsonbacteria bacterium CG03_land_8_20_14_0_80_36_12 TaxID=1974701 RepID=A0A2M7BYG1_9BACT|nr:MAG: hypothetical protein COS47_01085 [Candidatus Nealsonbacteria bacterium CG03_land_8_20_14_0_80_36_12]